MKKLESPEAPTICLLFGNCLGRRSHTWIELAMESYAFSLWHRFVLNNFSLIWLTKKFPCKLCPDRRQLPFDFFLIPFLCHFTLSVWI